MLALRSRITGRIFIKSSLSTNITSTSYSKSLHHPVKFSEVEDHWRQKDGISKQWKLIYKAPMNRSLNYLTTYLTVTTGVIGAVGAYYFIFAFDKDQVNEPLVLNDAIIVANSPMEGLVFLSSFLFLHFIVKAVLSKYVVRLYQHGDKYTAVFRGHIHDSVKTHQFNGKDFRKLPANSLFTWSHSRYGLGSRQGLLFENYFKTPEYYNDLVNRKKQNN